MTIDNTAVAVLIDVIIIDAVLAVDNAIVMGAAAAKLPPAARRKALVLGVGAAAALRALFALFAVKLLEIPGLAFAGGLMLVWVAWKLWRDMRAPPNKNAKTHRKLKFENATLRQAILQILIADVSMSLDNVIGVAGAAREHITVMIIGLLFSVLMMGFAANLLAKAIGRYRWILVIGITIILYVAATMIWEGGHALAIFTSAK